MEVDDVDDGGDGVHVYQGREKRRKEARRKGNKQMGTTMKMAVLRAARTVALCFTIHLKLRFFWWQCSYDSSVHRLLPPPLHTDTLPIGSTLTEKEEIMFKKIKKFYICGTQKI